MRLRRIAIIGAIYVLGLVILVLASAEQSRRAIAITVRSAVRDLTAKRIDSATAAAMIAEAQRQGAAHPRVAGNVRPRNLLERYQTGDSLRRCVEVEGASIVRSGEFSAGPFAFYPMFLRGSDRAALRWSPLFIDDPLRDTVVVRGTRLDRSLPDQEWVRRGVTAGSAGSYTFHTIQHLSPGRWMFVARRGPNWGCFLYDFSIFAPSPET
jgi:hypothetical protein